ncbi:MAG: substrate-binding domain-containing protein [Pseudomonadota bacterium]
MTAGLTVALSAVILMIAPVHAEKQLKMSTTTSTQNSGLLEALLPPFEKANNVKVAVLAVGTGKALKLGENGDVDVVFVHARAAEDKFVAAGYGVDRKDVMHNDFVIVGPKSDPAKVKEAKSASEAFKRISEGKAPFVSRGDDSGTDKKEKAVWKTAGIKPEGTWYLQAGQGMGPVLLMASEKQGYTLSDRGTYIAYEDKINLPILLESDKVLFNPYGIMAVNPKKHPTAQYELAKKFIDYVTGPEGQRIINNYKKKGKQLFYSDAVKNP